MPQTTRLGPISWERMIGAVEDVRNRLDRATAALTEAGIQYAVVGGNAVAAWVSRIDRAAVRNTRALGPDPEAVRRVVGKVLVDTVLEPRSRAQHDHQHQDAPEHPERRESRTQLVSAECGVDFMPVVQVEHHSSLNASIGRTLAALTAGNIPAAVFFGRLVVGDQVEIEDEVVADGFAEGVKLDD